MPWPIGGVCDMCDYFLGEDKADGKSGHCGYDGATGDGLCGANVKAKKKKK